MEEDRIDERSGVVPGSGMHDETGRFVHDKNVAILEDDVERDVFGFRLGRNGRRNENFYFVRVRHLCAGFEDGLAVHFHETRLNETFDPRSRKIGIDGGNPYVKTLAHQNRQALLKMT